MKKARYLLIALALLAACEVDSCFYGVQLGIHFHSADVDFGAPPPRFTVPAGLDEGIEDPWRAGSMRQSDNYNDGDDAAQARQRHLQELWAQSFSLEQQSRFEKAADIYRELQAKGALGIDAFGVRRIQLFSEAKPGPALKQYLLATHPNGKNPTLPPLESAPAYLKPYIAYEAASRLLQSGQLSLAATAYEQCATQYPDSFPADSALIMAARIHLEAMQPPILDAGVHDAEDLLRSYPKSRLANSATGLLARADYLQKHYPEAAVRYETIAHTAALRHDRFVGWESIIDCGRALNQSDLIGIGFVGLYANAGNNNEALYAVGHLTTTLGGMNKEESGKFRQYLLSHPDLLASYLQLRLEMTATKKEDREALATMAEQAPSLVPITQARLSQVCYADDDLLKASDFAQRAIRGSKDQGEAWQIGHYIFGSIKSRKADWPAAIAEYQLAAKAGDNNYLAVGAHEALALCYDRMGQEGKALDEYYWLHNWCQAHPQEDSFGPDIAYMLDAKMSPAQIRAYLESHPHSDQRNLLRYTLGLRLLRIDDYAAAESAFASIPTDTRKSFYKQGVQFDEGPIEDPLIVARELTALHKTIAAAGSEKAKPRALYALASFYYDKRDLLFYNAPLWQGQRSMGIGASWFHGTDSAADEDALKTHHMEHECLQRAYDVCMEILRRYPHSAQAPLAAYRAATASERLSHFNPYWRWRAAHGRMIDNTISLMRTVADKYPTSSVAKDARKYAKVYTDEKKQLEANDMWKNVPKWFQPGY